MYQNLNDIRKRTEWFMKDRFGMFIHWGLYSIPSRGEWVRNGERIPNEEYDKYMKRFNPVDFDPKKWAKEAKNAGMKYIVMTAKHHDGFCLFDSKFTDYKSTNTPYGKDIVKGYVEAVRGEGLKVGLYFSLLDWHHEHYPKYGDPYHPMRENEKFRNEEIDFDKYLEYMHNQVEELVSNYGKIDIIWFDFSYKNMSGEKWRATKLIEMVRKYQPQIIIDNRLEGSGEGFGSIVTENINYYAGDFVSPEQALPYQGIKNKKGEELPWELCLTMNNHWGYNSNDKDFKTSKVLIRKLVECVSKSGNMLLNIGPDARGNFPKESIQILSEMGDWMKLNSESVYGCKASKLPKPEWGYFTQSEDYLYAHIFDQPIGPLPLENIEKSDIEYIEKVLDYSELYISESWAVKSYDITFLDLPQNETAKNKNTDIDTVIRIKLKNDC
ncbi:MAG: alpha-L-fucosidase [Tissierellia bacterium]|nr:alpha-L-fucosidase [Tissierellia bacterium]